MKALKFLKSGATWALALSLLLVGVGQMVSLARTGGATNIHACVSKSTRMVRIPSAGFGCVRGEKPVSWSIKGPRGLKGLNGLNGTTGAQGPAGPAGPAGPSGPTGTFSSSGYTDRAFCLKKDGKLEGLKKDGGCDKDSTLMSIPTK